MAAPYRDFWIIVGMTVGAVVFAYGTSKTGRGPVSEVSNTNRPTGERSSQSADAKTLNTSPKIEAIVPAGQMSSGETKANIEPFQNREVRDIKPDFRRAFEDAVQVSLAHSPVQNPSLPEDEQTDGSTTVPTLETKVVRSTPPVFDIQKAEPGAGPIVEIGIGTGKTITNLNVREGPGPKYVLLETLGLGVPVVILAEENGWAHVRVSETGREGWVNKTFLRKD